MERYHQQHQLSSQCGSNNKRHRIRNACELICMCVERYIMKTLSYIHSRADCEARKGSSGSAQCIYHPIYKVPTKKSHSCNYSVSYFPKSSSSRIAYRNNEWKSQQLFGNKNNKDNRTILQL